MYLLFIIFCFDEAFSDGLTLANVSASISAFERTLLTHNSPFDRFAAGDANALTPAQKRGFNVFRSAQTRCFECHSWPTFTNNTFNALGVPDVNPNSPDLGQVEVVNGPDSTRAFRTPALRNVALTAPYMHNGVFQTLDEVVDFYAKGGGPAFGVDMQPDEFIRGFTLTPHATQVLDFFDPLQLREIYYPEVIALVQQVSGARRVVVFDHTIRKRMPASGTLV